MSQKKDNLHIITRESHVPFYYITINAFKYNKKTKKISENLENILDTDSDETVMVFTDNQVLKDLVTQINRLLESRQKVKVDYRRSEIASKKMLSNVSHDIKTPMTVIMGYLEIIRLNGELSHEMLSSFFTAIRELCIRDRRRPSAI